MTGFGSRQARKQEAAISALLAEPTIGQAAKVAGIGEKTLRRWLREPGFQAEYRAARRQALEGAIGALQQATGLAVQALVRDLDADAPQAVQVRAALGILEQAAKGMELLDLADRITALEKAPAGMGNE